IHVFGPALFDVLVTNSTLSGNSANHSGGAIILNGAGTVEVMHCTVTGNSARLGVGGLDRCVVGNTIFQRGPNGRNVNVLSLGSNLSDDRSGDLIGPGDQRDKDPKLGPLQDNGGPTLTQEPLPGSPAINRGNPNFTPPPQFDQRGAGHPRVVNGRIDIGSVEVQN